MEEVDKKVSNVKYISWIVLVAIVPNINLRPASKITYKFDFIYTNTIFAEKDV